MIKNKIFNKIKEFFRKILGKKQDVLALNSGNDNFVNREIKFINQISAKENIIEQNRVDDMAQKLLNYELFPSELTEKETEIMTEWFTKDIEEIDLELQKIKNHIINMKSQLQ